MADDEFTAAGTRRVVQASTPVTLQRVARHAGVSRQTVSNALNAPGRLHPDTLAKVQRAIDELGYRPNLSARSLRTRSAGLIGYCLPTRGLNSVMDRFLHGLCGAAEASGRRILLFTAPQATGPGGAAAELEVYADLLAQGAVDGFALADTVLDDPRPAWLAARTVPFASFGRTWSGPEIGPWVDVDGAAGTSAAVEHLVERGHRRIGFLGWPGGSATGEDRLDGWRRACVDAEIPVADLVARSTDSPEGGARAALRLLEAPAPPTALVCASDALGLGAIAAIRTLGLRPGHDVAVTGFDDSPLAAVAAPGLTSLRQPVEQAARHLVRLLDASGNAPPSSVLLTPTLVVRGSTDPTHQP